ncbi:MAG: hypothetical protein K6T16_01765 [Candidatus Pacearchaeota archaeon]|nr:hypothetical protein [Candidatus Pacearchaeota archaeon]
MLKMTEEKEERSKEEIIRVGEKLIAPEEVEALNYAFDIVPAGLITAIITEEGIFHPPYKFSRKG